MSLLEIILLGYIVAHLSLHLLQLFFNVLFRFYYGGNKILAKILAVPFVICDALVNIYSVSILYRELPQEWLVTERLKRWKRLPSHVKGIKRRRRDFAFQKCDELNEYDPGHC